jgi:hypothetical protein
MGESKPTNSVMSIDRGEEWCSNAVMRVLLVGDMGAVMISEFLRETKVDDVD